MVVMSRPRAAVHPRRSDAQCLDPQLGGRGALRRGGEHRSQAPAVTLHALAAVTETISSHFVSSYTNVQALGTSPKLADVDFALIVIIVIGLTVSIAGSSRHEGQLCGSRRRELEQARPPCARKSSSATTTRQQ